MRATRLGGWIVAGFLFAACGGGGGDEPVPLGITTTALPGATQGTAYSATLQASGGTQPHSWSLASGSLPTGLTLASSGAISGTPTGTGTSSFTVRVTDSASSAQTATKGLSIAVAASGALSVTTGTLPNGTTGTAYSTTLTATGGVAPYAWEVWLPATNGDLPPGVALNGGTGALSGTPTTQGAWSFTIRVTDASLPPQEAFASLLLSVDYASILTYTTTSLPNGTAGSPYSTPVQVTGGVAPYAWEVFNPGANGDLPPGLSLDPATGLIAGTPTTQGAWSFTVRVTDASLPPQEAFATLLLSVDYASVLTVTTTTLPNGTTGSPYSTPVQVSGGVAPYAWEVFNPAASGDLPPGLSLDPATGLIAGTPTTRGAWSFTIRVTDASLPSQEAFATLLLSVDYASILTVTTTSLPNATTGSPYSNSVTVADGTPPYAWEVFNPATSGDLPPGLSLDPATGAITGTPTTQGSWSFTLRVTDASLPPQEAFATLLLVVDYASILTITTTSLPGGTLNVPYSATLGAVDGTPPYAWEVFNPATSGDLPPGLSLDPATGAITGTPTTLGSWSFTVRVTDVSLPPQESFGTFFIGIQ